MKVGVNIGFRTQNFMLESFLEQEVLFGVRYLWSTLIPTTAICKSKFIQLNSVRSSIAIKESSNWTALVRALKNAENSKKQKESSVSTNWRMILFILCEQ